MPLMIDANQGYRLAEARRLADAVRDLGIEWFEEPMPNDRVSDYRSLRSASAVPLAGGERAYYPEDIARFIVGGRAGRRHAGHPAHRGSRQVA